MQEHIVIIGNGIAGVTAARHIRKRSDKRITIISAETDHFFSRTALMYVYMGHMKYEHIKPYEDWFWEKNSLELRNGYVESIDYTSKKLSFSNGESLSYDKLILAVGSKPNKFGWPGQDLKAVQGLYSYQDLESMEEWSDSALKHAVIVGGGLIGIEMAEMFRTRNIEVTFLVREKSFWTNVLPKEESEMVNRHILEHHIDLRLKEELEEIIGDENGRAKAVKTKSGEIIDCQFVGLTAGVRPNVTFLKETDLKVDKGIVVNEYLETNIPDVYAIGDCAQIENPIEGRRPVEAIWYTGRMMGEVLALSLTGEKTKYIPGTWFNSAKFLDIEYQVYGQISSEPGDDEEHIYWEHSSGKKSIRIVYSKAARHVIGFNLMGVRYRHEICDRWLREKKDIGYVLQNLRAANFDPEFYARHEKEVLEVYNNRNPQDAVSLKSKKSILDKIFG